jgi:hypothetical protein
MSEFRGLLVVLWVRSYWHWDAAVRGWGVTPQQFLALPSHSGGVSIQYLDARGNSMVSFFRWKITTMPAQDRDSVFTAGLWQAGTGFYWYRGSDGFLLSLPDWFLVPLLIALAAAPWLHYRFSLRTLLIAITLVAVVLGVDCVFLS